jgi:putative transposase
MNKRAYKYRFYPTKEQATLLAQTFGSTRFVYNRILSDRTKLYYDQKEKVGYTKASAMLTVLKKEPEYTWLNAVSCVPLQQCLRHQQTAFKNFFEGRAKYPAFKKKFSRQSAEFTKSAFKYKEGKIFIAKSKEPLNIKWSRDLPSSPSSITLSKDSANRYFISCLCEFEPKKRQVSPNTIGIDLGIKDLFITDKGEKVGNPRHTTRYATKLAKAQRRLSKKKLGSANRAKAKLKVARIHAKISDCRADNLHKLSRRLVNENQVICAETLRVKNMVRNPKHAKHIADASSGELTRQIRYKAEWAGRDFVQIDTFFPSSKRCACCGHIISKLPLNRREWTCPSCETKLDRDINAATNIKAAGLAVLAFGDTVNLL